MEAARVIKACANTEIEIDENAEVIDVCKAEQKMKEKARQEGIEQGIKEGLKEGRLESLRDSVRNIMESLHLGIEDAMKALKISQEDQEILMKMI